MFGSSKPGGQPPERTKAADPVAEQFDDVPPMPEAFKPVPATSTPAVSPPRKTFNFADKPKPQSSDEAAHLYIGANIRLKGEIASCEVMRVDGVYEGIAKTRQLIVCPGGSFFGTAEIEEAEIHGCFEGSLHVRGRLFLRKQGKIRGTFSSKRPNRPQPPGRPPQPRRCVRLGRSTGPVQPRCADGRVG